MKQSKCCMHIQNSAQLVFTMAQWCLFWLIEDRHCLTRFRHLSLTAMHVSRKGRTGERKGEWSVGEHSYVCKCDVNLVFGIWSAQPLQLLYLCSLQWLSFSMRKTVFVFFNNAQDCHQMQSWSNLWAIFTKSWTVLYSRKDKQYNHGLSLPNNLTALCEHFDVKEASQTVICMRDVCSLTVVRHIHSNGG